MLPKNYVEELTRHNTLRLHEFDYSARRIYFVTLIIAQRRKLFLDDQLTKATIECLKNLHHELKFNLYVYCFMPDHFDSIRHPVPDASPQKRCETGVGKSCET